jgi:hypothetical protein
MTDQKGKGILRAESLPLVASQQFAARGDEAAFCEL